LTAFFVFFNYSKNIEVNFLPNLAPVPLPTPDSTVKLIFVGDIMLSRQVGMKMAALNDYLFPFRKVADYLKSADIAFGNLESVISSKGIKVGSIYSFRADPRAALGLQYAGFDVVSIANNHIWDYSLAAFVDNLNNLKTVGIGAVGGGMNFAEAHSPWIKEINGEKIAYLAYTDLLSVSISAGADSPRVSYLDETQMIADIQKAKSQANIVVVSMHEGDEYQTKHNAKQEQIAKIAIDTGASLIIGHHPHVVQEVEPYKNGWIAYSLGNFVFDQYFSKETMSGLILEVTVENRKITSVKQIKTEISNDFQVGIPVVNK